MMPTIESKIIHPRTVMRINVAGFVSTLGKKGSEKRMKP